MAIKKEEGALAERAVPGPPLYFSAVIPDAPRAFVGIIHGYADHGARYSHVMDAWGERGIGSVAIDMRGHGRATGARGYCDHFDEFLDDATELARLVSARASGSSPFLFGHSFGGLVAAASAIETPRSWRGVLLDAPYFDLAFEVPKFKLFAGKIASRIAPRIALPSGLNGGMLTHDQARARAYEDDPLVFKKATARWHTETVAAQKRTQQAAHKLTLPLLMTCGSDDPIASVSASRAFFDAAGSSDKRWEERAGLYHEILNEPEWPSIASLMADWILTHAT